MTKPMSKILLGMLSSSLLVTAFAYIPAALARPIFETQKILGEDIVDSGIPYCARIPPNPADRNWGACGTATTGMQQNCQAHTHTQNEVGRCSQTDSNIEVHIKCAYDAVSDDGTHNYCVRIANIDCTGIPDSSASTGSGSVPVTPTCNGEKKCCRGPLTGDADQRYCAGLSDADRAANPRCNNVFMLCGNLGAATLSDQDKRRICENRRRCTQPECTLETVVEDPITGKPTLRCLEYQE